MEEKENQIRRIVCEKLNITETELSGRGRSDRVAFARHVCMHLIKKHTPMTYEKIGEMFGGRGPDAVAYAYEGMKDRLSVEPKTREIINSIEALL